MPQQELICAQVSYFLVDFGHLVPTHRMRDVNARLETDLRHAKPDDPGYYRV
tara:strand:- start:694 stop:849 length:156 start_codon:yes stop_codon:yes gene_type:complete